MHYEIQGKPYPEFDWDWTLQEAFFVKEKAFITISQFPAALQQQDPHAIAALIWVVKRRAGEKAEWNDIVANYKFSDFQVIQDDNDPAPADEDVDALDPPRGSGEKRSKPAGKNRMNAT